MGFETVVAQVAELLLAGPCSVEDLARLVNKHPRHVYRALKALQAQGWDVVRIGTQTEYKYRIIQ